MTQVLGQQNGTINRSRLQGPQPLSITEMQVLSFLLPLSQDYPCIEHWYLTKVVPGLRDGTRLLLKIERHGQIVGVGIGKRDASERKICTVRVAPTYFGRGLGPRLFDELLKWLDTDNPHLTVSEVKLPLFERLFDRYGFKCTSRQSGLYVKGVTEHSYNDCWTKEISTQICKTSSNLKAPETCPTNSGTLSARA